MKSSIDYFTWASRKHGQRTTVITCDQAIYDIAKALILKHKGLYRTVILRLGGFHIAENFFKAIGFFFRCSGIEELMMNSGLCGPGTANKVMAGKDYYLMLRLHSAVSDAMLITEWKAFETHLSSQGHYGELTALKTHGRCP